MPKVKEDAPERVECRYKLSWAAKGGPYQGGDDTQLALEFIGSKEVEIDYHFGPFLDENTGVMDMATYFQDATFVSSTPITKQQIADVVSSDAFRVFKRVVVFC